MNQMTVELSFELWAREVYLQYPEIVASWNRSTDPYMRAKSLLIMKYACRESGTLREQGRD